MMKTGLLITLLASLVFLCGGAIAQDGKQFSADVVDTHPQHGVRNGKLFIGDGRVRSETDIDGQILVQIRNMKSGEAFTLNPADKTYTTMPAMPMPGAAAAETPGKAANPCSGQSNLPCESLGQKTLAGRKATGWEIQLPGGQGKATIWIDDERGFPLLQENPDGSSMSAIMTGKEKMNGRNTEKWQLTMTAEDGSSQSRYQWYDPELQVNVREEQPDVFSRDLKNIIVGPQPDTVFSVPAGYRKIEPGQGGSH